MNCEYDLGRRIYGHFMWCLISNYSFIRGKYFIADIFKYKIPVVDLLVANLSRCTSKHTAMKRQIKK